jgi:hypothetical protein
MGGLRPILVAALWLFVPTPGLAQPSARLVHVFVALADNAHQGIVPVPAALGNGEDLIQNLYWGAAFGGRTFFRKSSDWKEIATVRDPNPYVIERAVFLHATSQTYLLADAYRGTEIKQAITDFFRTAAGSEVGAFQYQDKANGRLLRLPATTSWPFMSGTMD